MPRQSGKGAGPLCLRFRFVKKGKFRLTPFSPLFLSSSDLKAAREGLDRCLMLKKSGH
jgi:hypothetical protein